MFDPLGTGVIPSRGEAAKEESKALRKQAEKPADPPPPPTNAYHKPAAHKAHPNQPSNLIKDHQDPGTLAHAPKTPNANVSKADPSKATQPTRPQQNADPTKAATSAADAARTVASNTARAADAATRAREIIDGKVRQANDGAATARAAVNQSQSARSPARPTEVSAGEQAKADAHPDQQHGTNDPNRTPTAKNGTNDAGPVRRETSETPKGPLGGSPPATRPETTATPRFSTETKPPADSSDPAKQVATTGTQPTKQGAKPASGKPAPAASAKGAEPSSSTAEASVEQPERPGAESGVPGFAEGVPMKQTGVADFGRYLQSIADPVKLTQLLNGIGTQLAQVSHALQKVATALESKSGDSFATSNEGGEKKAGGEAVASNDRRVINIGRFRGGLRG